MADILSVNKDLIPYEFDKIIGEKLFTFGINYNQTGDYFTLDLSDSEGIISRGEKVVLNTLLFSQQSEDFQGNRNDRYPNTNIVALDLSQSVSRLGFSELGDTVFIYLIQTSELS